MKFVVCFVTILALQEVFCGWFSNSDSNVIHTWKLSDKSLTGIPSAVVHDTQEDKLYLSIPRVKTGIPDTLVQLTKKDKENSPKLKPFVGQPKKSLTSVYHLAIDECKRLWVLDAGRIDNNEEKKKYVTQIPMLIAFDLRSHNKSEIYRGDLHDVLEPTFFGQFAVDVINPESGCDRTFIYIPNDKENMIYVHDMKTRGSWIVENKFSYYKPQTKTVLDAFGKDLKYESGIRAISLGDRNNQGHREAYYIVGSGTKVWRVNTAHLKQYTFTNWTPILVGDRGKDTEAPTMVYDPKTKVIFFAEPKLNRISCWNTKREFTDKNLDVVYKKENISVTDFSVDQNGNLWFMSYESSNSWYDWMLFWKSDEDMKTSLVEVMKLDTAKIVKNTKCA